MNSTITTDDAAWVKLDLLAHGIQLSSTVADTPALSLPFAARRNVYNSPVWQTPTNLIPQELKVLGLVVGVNSYGASPWTLRVSHESNFLLERTVSGIVIEPELIPDLHLFNQQPHLTQLANIYGGAALAFFSPRNCYFFADQTQCGFCSLAGTAEESNNFKGLLTESDVRQVVREALVSDRSRIEQVMIVGGNMRDLDRGFSHHVNLAEAVSKELQAAETNSDISIHIATMPPRNLGLINLLKDIPNIHVMFNLEVWDTERFAEVCPGKARDYGRNQMLRSLEKLRDVIGPYRAHSLLVTGLEDPTTTIAGATALSEMGISPVINIYHSDKHARFGKGSRPSFEHLSQIALGTQELHDAYPIQPYWRKCGRNAINSEASRGLFRKPPRQFLVT